MQIPQPDNVANVLVDGKMWFTTELEGTPGWSHDVHWRSVRDFAAFLDSATEVVFYSPTGRVIEPD